MPVTSFLWPRSHGNNWILFLSGPFLKNDMERDHVHMGTEKIQVDRSITGPEIGWHGKVNQKSEQYTK